MKLEVFDERRCVLGEGPVSTGPNHLEIKWVDILGQRVLSRNLETCQTEELYPQEDVSFVIPRENGEDFLGISSNPLLTRNEIDPTPIRWNDAKVSPTGDLWLGTMAYNEKPHAAALYRLSAKNRFLTRVLDGVTISNGIDWSDDGETMYYIDSPTYSVDAFDVVNGEIFNRRTVLTLDPEGGFPDGMCIDAEGGMWIAFWAGAAVRRYDIESGFALSEIIKTPASRTTSCTFAGPNWDSLIITSAHMNAKEGEAQAGMTFICKPGVKGRATRKLPL